MITTTQIIIGIATWHILGAIIGLSMGFAQYFVGSYLKKLQLREMTKNAPEVIDTRKKSK